MVNVTGRDSLKYYLEQEYPITIYKAEEGGYVAEIEDLPGCLTEAETLDEVMEHISEARRLWIETAYENGMEIPVPRTEIEYSGKFVVRLPKYLHRRLTEQASKEGISLNSYVLTMLSDRSAIIENNQEIVQQVGTELEKVRAAIVVNQAPILRYFSEPPLYDNAMIRVNVKEPILVGA